MPHSLLAIVCLPSFRGLPYSIRSPKLDNLPRQVNAGLDTAAIAAMDSLTSLDRMLTLSLGDDLGDDECDV